MNHALTVQLEQARTHHSRLVINAHKVVQHAHITPKEVKNALIVIRIIQFWTKPTDCAENGASSQRLFTGVSKNADSVLPTICTTTHLDYANSALKTASLVMVAT